jgi:hypothetical protein
MQNPSPSTFIGAGKLDEITSVVINASVSHVIFDDELSPAQGRNIQKVLGAGVQVGHHVSNQSNQIDMPESDGDVCAGARPHAADPADLLAASADARSEAASAGSIDALHASSAPDFHDGGRWHGVSWRRRWWRQGRQGPQGRWGDPGSSRPRRGNGRVHTVVGRPSRPRSLCMTARTCAGVVSWLERQRRSPAAAITPGGLMRTGVPCSTDADRRACSTDADRRAVLD